MPNIGQELLNVPFPEMVEAMGMAIARAQHSLDMNSVKMAQIMSGGDWLDEDEQGKEVVQKGLRVSFGGRMLSLLELGFTPTFYQFVDTVIEVKISVSMKSETSESRSSTNVNMNAKAKVGWGSVGTSMSISTVSASFSARNSFSAEGASLIRTKLVPLPPPAVLTERVRALMEDSKRKDMALDPVVLAFNVGDTTSQTVTADVELDTLKEVKGLTLLPVQNNTKAFTVAATTAEEGVLTVNVSSKDKTKNGMIKVLVTKKA